MANNLRQRIIDYGNRTGKTAGEIDRAIRKTGDKGLTLKEFNQISPVKNIGKDIISDIGNIGAGIVTASSLLPGAVRSTLQGKALKQVKDFLSEKENVVGIADALMSPYNVSVEKISEGTVSPWDIAQGIKEHPVTAGLDISTLGVGKGISKAGGKIAESQKIADFVSDKSVLKSLKQAVAPSKSQREFSKAIARARVDAKVRQHPTMDLERDVFQASVSKDVDFNQAVKNLATGKWQGNAATKKTSQQIRDIIQAQSKAAQEAGLLTKEAHTDNVIAQYMTYELPDLIHKQSLDFIKNIREGKEVPKNILDKYKEGEALYKGGQIDFLSQVKAPTKGFGRDEKGWTGYFSTERYGGKTSPEKIAKVLPETFDYINRELAKQNVATESIDYVLNNLGRQVKFNELKEIADKAPLTNKVYVNLKNLRRAAQDTFLSGGRVGLSELIQNADDSESIVRAIASGKAKPDDFKGYYEVDPEDLKAIAREVEGLNTNKLNSLMKKALLTLPKWVVENRISNIWNNYMDGVGIEDYIKAISEYDRAPGQIDELTSYTGYTGESLHRTKIKEGWQSALIKLKKHRKDNDLLGVLDAVNEIFALPVARPEALLEKADRFANFVSHARRYANKNDLKLDDVLERARTDSQFFWKLYENTNKALGDYLGRNLYIPNKFYSNLGWIYPFWKFPAQTARITGGQIVRDPLKFQASVLAPSKIGSAEWEKTREEYGLSPEDYTGGIPYYKSINPNIPSEVMQLGGNQYAALGDLTRMLFGTSEGGLTGFNPILSSVSRIGNVSTPFGTPASIPGTVVINGRRYDVDKYGNPIGEHEVTPLERLGFVSKEALSTLFAPYRQASLVGRPLGFTARNLASEYMPELGLQPAPMFRQYSTVINPLSAGDPYSVGKLRPAELIGSQYGTPVKSVYREYKIKPSQLKRLRKPTMRKKGRTTK